MKGVKMDIETERVRERQTGTCTNRSKVTHRGSEMLENKKRTDRETERIRKERRK